MTEKGQTLNANGCTSPLIILRMSTIISPRARFLKVPKTLGPEKPFVKLRPAHFVKLVFSYDVWGMKIKTAKFRALRRLYFEDTKRSMSPELHPKSFRTFEKRAPGLEKCRRTFQPRSQHPLCRL